ncbi:hypothetical protein LNP17_10320 [Klebsiella variicola subsp. variicola]|nr:hypothetical protein [Klebsiella variicola subsp. variicola]
MGAADANRRNFQALARLSGHFPRPPARHGNPAYFSPRSGQKSIIFATPRRIFANAPWKSCVWPSPPPPGCWSFSPPLSIALVAVYFGFSYLGELNFGHYGAGVTLMAGFLTLILAPEFSSRYVTWAPSAMPKLRPWAPQTA